MRIRDGSSDVCSSDLHPTSVGPAQLEAWSRFVGAPDDPGVNQGLLAFATEGMLIATAMRPHEGVAQSLAHRTIATSVISHTITFHEPCPAGDWFLLSLESPFAGGGRIYGRHLLARRAGQLVPSFTQDNLICPLPVPPPHPPTFTYQSFILNSPS